MTDSAIDSILAYNKDFVAADSAAPYRAEKKPRKKVAVVACMDTRLITLLTAALGLKNGDANVITNAGAEVADPFGTTMRSLLVAIYELGVDTVMVVAHTDCGAQHMTGKAMTALMKKAGITDAALESVSASGVDLDDWLEGFGDADAAVRRSVKMVQEHPLVAQHVTVKGYIMETETGELMPVE